MKKRTSSFRSNAKLARATWGELSKSAIHSLKSLTEEHGLLVAAGDLQLLEGRWYVTHAGLLRISERRRCCGIRTLVERRLSDPACGRWVFKAIVYKASGSKGFVGYGDADPSNVSSLVHGAEMRVAETRAVNRALRKAYGIGLCSVEELGYLSSPAAPSGGKGTAASSANGNSSHNRQPRLRDRLCLLIRQYNLDPNLRLQAQFVRPAFGGEAMKRHIPGLHARQQDAERPLEGLFLTRVEWASYRWHPNRPFLAIRFIVLESESFERRSFSGRLYSTERALWKLNWFLRDFGYDPELLNQDQIDEKALFNLRGVVRTSHVTLNGRTFQNLEAFAPAAEWEELSHSEADETQA